MSKQAKGSTRIEDVGDVHHPLPQGPGFSQTQMADHPMLGSLIQQYPQPSGHPKPPVFYHRTATPNRRAA